MTNSRVLSEKDSLANLFQNGDVAQGHIDGVDGLPLVITPNKENVDLIEWIKGTKDSVNKILLDKGGILFRGFNVDSTEYFERFTEELTDKLEQYNERSTPRSEVQGRVYTSTEYPAEEHIPMHNESSYAHAWARKLWFYCSINAEEGGETPIADSRVMYKLLDPKIIKLFTEKKLMYVRNMGGNIDLPWQEVYQTDDKNYVEEYCKKTGTEFEWLPNDVLRTKSVRSAVAKHPVTGEMLWFNQAHLFHYSSLPEEIREYLLMTVKEENLSRNVLFGDGTPIDTAILDEIRDVYKEATVAFRWQEGDIMMLDNMLVGHARNPYKGKRKVLVAMAEPYSDYGL